MSDQETTPATEPAAVEPAEAPAAEAPAAPAKPERPKGYAIIETGGKQYRVTVGDRISVERLAGRGRRRHHDRSRAPARRRRRHPGRHAGRRRRNGHRPVDDHFRGEKIVVFKYKPKKRYRRRIGHRQELTRLTITGING